MAAAPAKGSAPSSAGASTLGVDATVLALALGQSAVGRASGTLIRPHEGTSQYKREHSSRDLLLTATMLDSEKGTTYNPTAEEYEAMGSVLFNRLEGTSSSIDSILLAPYQFQGMSQAHVDQVIQFGLPNTMAMGAAMAVDNFGATTDATQFLVYAKVQCPNSDDLWALGQRPEQGLFLEPANPPLVGTVWLFTPRRKR